ncbi:hypothetical protein U1Q18_003375, partial [Sarracenia purpurea var. burkii]
LVAIEARILRIKGLSPVSFGGPADSGPEASLTVREGELSQSPSVQGLLKDHVVLVISTNDVVLKEITDSEGEISDLGEEGSEHEGTELNSVVKDDDLANKDKDGDETVGVTLAQEPMGKNKLPLDHALKVFDEKSCSSSVTKLMAEAAIVEGKGKGSINGTVVESNKPDSDVEGSVAEDCSVGAVTGEGNSEFTFLSAMDNVVDGGRINSGLVRVGTPSGMVEDVPKVAKFGYRSCAHLVFDEMHDEDLVHVDVSKKQGSPGGNEGKDFEDFPEATSEGVARHEGNKARTTTWANVVAGGPTSKAGVPRLNQRSKSAKPKVVSGGDEAKVGSGTIVSGKKAGNNNFGHSVLFSSELGASMAEEVAENEDKAREGILRDREEYFFAEDNIPFGEIEAGATEGRLVSEVSVTEDGASGEIESGSSEGDEADDSISEAGKEFEQGKGKNQAAQESSQH